MTPAGRRAPLLSPIPAVLLAVVSVQGGAALAKGLFPAVGATGAAGLRLVLASVMLLAFFRPPLMRYTRAQWAAVIPYGLALGVMNLTYYLSIARIPLGLAVTLEFVGPFALAVVGSRRALDFLWVLFAAAGIVLITPWTARPDGLDPLGVVLALAAGACWAVYILVGGRLSRRVPEGEGVAAGMVFATLTVLPFALVGGHLERLTPGLFAASVGVALLSSALPYTLEMRALGQLSSRAFGILMSLEPAVAALAGWAFLREHLTPLQWLAVALVSFASAGATLTGKRPEPPVEA
ncbi:EamA family transporter [Corallococcus llansteffanensis]|uniref:DMT family transporter n=1 Tax=Corallococcus llansteffanensis TaxID=2316731 RepID=A0A3A8P449_9BACT|nr:DMT family transporter [Corallococcus llansteffanensis]RKH49311.1 DMT family transporter [Corallococcus llansteffanensis]